MNVMRIVLPAMVAAAGFFIATSTATATPELAKKEKTGCKSCHVSAKSKELSDVGKCYKDEKDLKKCKK